MNPRPTLRVLRLNERAVLPVRATEHASGLDLRATDDVVLEPGARALVPTGLAIEIPHGFEGQVRPRSGLAAHSGVTVLNAPGTIDSDYRGEVRVILVNHGHEPFAVRAGDRVAQLVICPVTRVEMSEVPELSPTARGGGGFGHTGT